LTPTGCTTQVVAQVSRWSAPEMHRTRVRESMHDQIVHPA
jgi:hypothetical protein